MLNCYELILRFPTEECDYEQELNDILKIRLIYKLEYSWYTINVKGSIKNGKKKK